MVPHIKVEPSNYVDVNLDYDENGDFKEDYSNGDYPSWNGTHCSLKYSVFQKEV